MHPYQMKYGIIMSNRTLRKRHALPAFLLVCCPFRPLIAAVHHYLQAYPIDRLMDAVAEYQESSKQKVTCQASRGVCIMSCMTADFPSIFHIGMGISIFVRNPPPPPPRCGYQVFVEYVVLSGVNDGPDQARELGALLKVACYIPQEIFLPTHHPVPSSILDTDQRDIHPRLLQESGF